MYEVILTNFKTNSEDVDRLVNFDREVLQVVELSLADSHERLKPLHSTAQMNGGRILEIVRGIRNNDSLRSKYATIFNQAIVLLVSHFASTLGDIFRTAVIASLDRGNNDHLMDEEIKMTFREMKERGWNLKTATADLLVAKRDFTFQDMQSTVRAFETYVGVTLLQDQTTNNIILGQAARHVIVHSGGIASERTSKQISKANPRTLKPNLSVGEAVQFSADEVLRLKDDMLEYVLRVIRAVQVRE